MYACSDGKVGEWPTDGISFQDPSPLGVGAVVNHIVVELYGSYSCDNGNNMFGVYANDVPLNILWEGRSHACECGSCDPVTKVRLLSFKNSLERKKALSVTPSYSLLRRFI